MAVDMFLKLEDIPGESKDKIHKDEIVIFSFQRGAAANGDGRFFRGGAGAGKVHLSESPSRTASRSPRRRCSSRSRQASTSKEAVITVRKAGKTTTSTS